MKPLIRSYQTTDAEKLIRLYNRVFDRKIDREYWKWKTEKNPAGPVSAKVAVLNDEIVGQYAALPVKLKIGDHIMTCCQVVDSLVAPEYRKSLSKNRLFGALAKACFKDFEKSNLPVAFGFPNRSAAAYGRKILHYEDVGILKKYVKPLDAGAVFQHSEKFSSASLRFLSRPLFALYQKTVEMINHSAYRMESCSIEEVENFPPEADEIARKFTADRRLAIVRDREYLQWRYVVHPLFKYRIYELKNKQGRPCCWIVARLIETGLERVCCIMDWILDVADPEYKMYLAYLLIRVVRDFTKERRVSKIITYYLGNDWIARLLMLLGFLRRPKADEVFLVVRTWNQNINLSMLKNPNNWYSMIGDCDGW